MDDRVVILVYPCGEYDVFPIEDGTPWEIEKQLQRLLGGKVLMVNTRDESLIAYANKNEYYQNATPRANFAAWEIGAASWPCCNVAFLRLIDCRPQGFTPAELEDIKGARLEPARIGLVARWHGDCESCVLLSFCEVTGGGCLCVWYKIAQAVRRLNEIPGLSARLEIREE